MISVLQINSLNINEVDSFLFNGVSSILNVSKSELDISASIFDESQNFLDFDVIILGIHDQGILLSQDLSDFLIKFRDAQRGGILFTHGCPKIWNEINPEADLSQNQNKLNWLTSVAHFGIENFNSSFNYIFFSTIYPNTPHSILTSPFPISKELPVQETHNTGLVLSKDCQVLIPNPLDNSDCSFYLAIFEEANKGKVAHLSFGHNKYSSKNLFLPALEEAQLFANVLFWLSCK